MVVRPGDGGGDIAEFLVERDVGNEPVRDHRGADPLARERDADVLVDTDEREIAPQGWNARPTETPVRVLLPNAGPSPNTIFS